jgi:hypothetical protein
MIAATADFRLDQRDAAGNVAADQGHEPHGAIRPGEKLGKTDARFMTSYEVV